MIGVGGAHRLPKTALRVCRSGLGAARCCSGTNDRFEKMAFLANFACLNFLHLNQSQSQSLSSQPRGELGAGFHTTVYQGEDDEP